MMGPRHRKNKGATTSEGQAQGCEGVPARPRDASISHVAGLGLKRPRRSRGSSSIAGEASRTTGTSASTRISQGDLIFVWASVRECHWRS